MNDAKVIYFGENTGTMTYQEGLDFIERTRRQLDRLNVAIPNAESNWFLPPEEITSIRQKLDELEASFRKDLGYE